jgi:hypothetical protein
MFIYDIGFDADRFAGNAKYDGGIWRKGDNTSRLDY